MNNLPCGRAEMCTWCFEIRPTNRLDVCISVGVVATMPDPEDIRYEDIHHITYISMAGSADDDDYVTPEMREAAVGSAIELIR